MTPFNPNKKYKLPLGEALDPLFKMEDREDAIQYFEGYVAYQQKFIDSGEVNPNGQTARQIALDNIGYYAGYIGSNEQQRVKEWLGAEHPIFKDIVEY